MQNDRLGLNVLFLGLDLIKKAVPDRKTSKKLKKLKKVKEKMKKVENFQKLNKLEIVQYS